jgi:hypothetical protein
MFNAQQFAARLADRQDRWSLLTEFVAEWHTPLQEGDGYSAAELDAAEQRLGLKLPLALREWCQVAGQREDITFPRNALLHPSGLHVENSLLVFHVENQWVVEWGIQVDDLDLDNPPVWLDDSGLHDTPQEPIRENDTLSEFALQMVVFETITRPQVLQGYSRGASLALDTVERRFVHLGFPDWHWPLYPTRFYGGNDILIQVIGDQELHVAARSRAAFKEVETALKTTREHHPVLYEDD